MSFLPVALKVAGIGLKLLGTIQQMQSVSALAKYNVAVAERQGEIEEQRLKREKRLMLGKMRAGYGAAGVTLEGSPLEVLSDTASQFERDISISRYNVAAKRGVYGYEAQIARQRGYAGIGGTLLTQGTSWYSKWRTPHTYKGK